MSAPGRLDRWLMLLAVATVGLAIATVHWLGLLFGAAAVGLFGRTIRRGVLLGVAFGIVVVGLFIGELWLAEQLDRVVAMGEIAAIAVVIPLVLGAIGGLARGVVPTTTDSSADDRR